VPRPLNSSSQRTTAGFWPVADAPPVQVTGMAAAGTAQAFFMPQYIAPTTSAVKHKNKKEPPSRPLGGEVEVNECLSNNSIYSTNNISCQAQK